MEMRAFGRTGMEALVLGFGFGAVGGLMVRGDLRDQELDDRTRDRCRRELLRYRCAIRQRRVGGNLRPRFARAPAHQRGRRYQGPAATRRLRSHCRCRDQIARRQPGAAWPRAGRYLSPAQFNHHDRRRVSLGIRQVLDEVVPAFERLRDAGKTRFLGLTGVGDTAALLAAIDARAFDSAQVVYNMLNPSAAVALPANYPAQDYGWLFGHTEAAGVGAIGIRVLAGGALSGLVERHPIASPPPEPIGSAVSYEADVARARRLMPLVDEGFAASLSEAATRFALSHPAIGTILVGMATPQQFDDALAAVQKGPLPPAALDRLRRCGRNSSVNHGDRWSCQLCKMA